jgi:hypothetical protein
MVSVYHSTNLEVEFIGILKESLFFERPHALFLLVVILCTQYIVLERSAAINEKKTHTHGR